MVGKRRYPMIGHGGGVVSWVHLDDAAAATALAIEHAGPTIYNIVDDDPAATREWLPVWPMRLVPSHQGMCRRGLSGFSSARTP